jgi:hypothetical protein
MHAAGFKPTISAGERPQTYTSDRAAAGIVEEENCYVMLRQATNTIFRHEHDLTSLKRIKELDFINEILVHHFLSVLIFISVNNCRYYAV